MPNVPVPEGDTDVLSTVQSRLKRPSLYRVLLHNDDYTTTEFVVMILATIFDKSEPEAVRIMLSVHKTGKGLAGVYPHAIAETKIIEAHELAKENEFPFRLTMESE
ncbi:MAG: ATP-dependent Clp protease adaptor ClpS [Lentisphaeria bacterium]|nr:ATP-dependent Clp protease adaptor ClpS [Lentisphaeria bacterium]